MDIDTITIPKFQIFLATNDNDIVTLEIKRTSLHIFLESSTHHIGSRTLSNHGRYALL